MHPSVIYIYELNLKFITDALILHQQEIWLYLHISYVSIYLYM